MFDALSSVVDWFVSDKFIAFSIEGTVVTHVTYTGASLGKKEGGKGERRIRGERHEEGREERRKV